MDGWSKDRPSWESWSDPIPLTDQIGLDSRGTVVLLSKTTGTLGLDTRTESQREGFSPTLGSNPQRRSTEVSAP